MTGIIGRHGRTLPGILHRKEGPAAVFSKGANCSEDGPLSRAAIANTDESDTDAQTQAAVRELLAILPADVLQEIKSGEIDARDPAFLSGLMDHASRLSVADPQNGRRILGRIMKLRKQLTRTLRDLEPTMAVSATILNEGERTGRNAPCPCGSGRKFKQCCRRKA